MPVHTELWPIEDLVLAQRMACAGHSLDDIAAALGRPSQEVRGRLDPDPDPVRQRCAGVGYAHIKARHRDIAAIAHDRRDGA